MRYSQTIIMMAGILGAACTPQVVAQEPGRPSTLNPSISAALTCFFEPRIGPAGWRSSGSMDITQAAQICRHCLPVGCAPSVRASAAPAPSL